MKKIFVLFALSASMVACNNTATSEGESTESEAVNQVETIKKEVMVLHDKTMAQMGEMGQLTTRLKAASSEATDTAAYYNVINDLTQAKESMMDWMHGFENPDEMEVSEEEKIEYLEGQKSKMSDIADYTDRSIEKAKELLSK